MTHGNHDAWLSESTDRDFVRLDLSQPLPASYAVPGMNGERGPISLIRQVPPAAPVGKQPKPLRSSWSWRGQGKGERPLAESLVPGDIIPNRRITISQYTSAFMLRARV